MDRREHWEGIYRSREPDEVSWYQPRAALSLELIRAHLPDREAPILDVGGGASTLVDDLLADGYRDVTVLDVSPSALDRVRERLGPDAPGAELVVADALTAPLAPASVALWHDRAVFHFLTEEADRARYREQLEGAVRPGGRIVVATFAADGPTRCSGLEVTRYDPEGLHDALGRSLERVASRREIHRTPSGGRQAFTWAVFRRPSHP